MKAHILLTAPAIRSIMSQFNFNILAKSIFATAILVGIATLQPVMAEEPSFEAIAGKVNQATSPNAAYTAVVSQTVTGAPVAHTALSTPNGTPTTENASLANGSFQVAYDPSIKGFSIQKQVPPGGNSIAPTNHAASQTMASVAVAAPNVKAVVNLTSALATLSTWRDKSISVEQIGGVKYYKLVASNEKVTYTLYVNPSGWFVSQAIMKLNGKIFATVNVDYRRVDAFWMPSKVLIEHPDGTTYSQEFSDYKQKAQ